MLKKITLTLFIVTFAFIAQASAQTAVPSEKQAAIKELIGLMNAGSKAEEFVAVFEKQMSSTRVTIIESILNDRADLTEADRKTLREAIVLKMEGDTKNFQERLMRKLNYNELIDEVAAIVYDKYFTVEEIKDLIAFYKTPTGQKALRTMTPLMTDTMQLTMERILPKIPVVIEELQQEERQYIEKEVNTRKPRPKKPVSE